ncbi:PAS domain-containing protein, partial [Nostoc sp. CHAB 5715]|uniref:PAS domain-containing protein n=1 Tax=Nostoc sp. CHAB 5715 TaxID=2780400 RepID=UPI001E62FF66|nr:PAS domain-containing protein [Nostoc sp. CHAB 5715]
MDETVVKSLYTPNCQQGAINLLSKLAVNLPGLIFQVLQQQDGSVLVLYISSGCEYLYELEPEAIQKDFRVLYKMIHPQDIKAFTESIAFCTTNITSWHWEGRIITPSGIKWIQATSQPELQEAGDFLWN